ncbi:XRE family transcriptional regulator [Acidocella sp. MX-AZ02]|nr:MULTISPECIES: helix-turn-helix transcriptional regulator [unclassified Acidocella]EKM98199.1 XRE family transcriptional regulator [Acidocella sp. MX-AZ02]WBO61057.1 helix-turn-helix domain-containing protein [Acidocella sp. MX-AZ03]
MRQQYLTGLERGQRNPTVITLYELAQVLEVTVADLVQADEERKNAR